MAIIDLLKYEVLSEEWKVEVEVESLFSLFSSKAVPQKWQLSTF
jgi:hypothetical protein